VVALATSAQPPTPHRMFFRYAACMYACAHLAQQAALSLRYVATWEARTDQICHMALQALQYMRKVCSHPALVLEPGNEAHADALQEAAPGAALPLRGVQHAPKLAALRDLLAQCGIGHPAEGGSAALRVSSKRSSSPSRALSLHELLSMLANADVNKHLHRCNRREIGVIMSDRHWTSGCRRGRRRGRCAPRACVCTAQVTPGSGRDRGVPAVSLLQRGPCSTAERYRGGLHGAESDVATHRCCYPTA
jgi:hypothetical protein